MASQLVIEVLSNKLKQLVSEKDVAIIRYNKEISEIETALLELEGKKVWEISPAEKFDDENPDYIKSSIED